mmetsp:Transcript_32415/g.23948  ORF Transcript_32415/g.23948 Transcript_32415/m.23948 type:complete len:132 (+) Transcript_32415:178-573(+)
MHTLVLTKRQVACLKEVLATMKREEGKGFEVVEEAANNKVYFLSKDSQKQRAGTAKISPSKGVSPGKSGLSSHLASVYNSVPPSSGYIHEWQKHKYKAQHTTDLVRKYQQHQKFWTNDKFLQQNHSGVKNN